MRSSEVRDTFLRFFAGKQHHIVPSAPMVIKDDPTLMFTNAGMNQFKDIFLGNSVPANPRVADTQKCLRVSGKHNDLDEVGHDTYHHTMFEMLGNWSFGDYFKKEAIEWAWELLTEVYKIEKNSLYVTVFGGDSSDNLPSDTEAFRYWSSIVPESQILFGSKKDNFWEMGDTGPCGPCSEIHVDIRHQQEKLIINGSNLVNKGHPQVIEIWNLVFIEYNRTKSGELVRLPSRHIDTGMGFERLCMVLQNKQSNYDTDVFQPIIQTIAQMTHTIYGASEKPDIAMRVIADHLRAVSFAIADGQLPSNTGAGYVIRRILRRAIRYAFTFFNMQDPFIFKLVPVLTQNMGATFPELSKQKELIMRVISEEETAFLRTLSQGIKKFDQYIENHPEINEIDGNFTFELFDTYGFPVDLTALMAREKGLTVDMQGFNEGLKKQKERSKNAAQADASDWIVIDETVRESGFRGYDELITHSRIARYRTITSKKNTFFEVVLDITPFYAESGGQVGDTGFLQNDTESVEVINTIKQNNLIVHITGKMFKNPNKPIIASVNKDQRLLTACNHSATHLLHAALKTVLGNHVEQRGSLVGPMRLRFDFSHFSRVENQEIRKIEALVNQKIRDNISLDIMNNIPIEEARKMGAAALFGEKYGSYVRVVGFDKDFSLELCGGTHTEATGKIGLFRIVSESAIAAGIRRIEAVTGAYAEEFVNSKADTINEISDLLKNPSDIVAGVKKLVEENTRLSKTVASLEQEKVKQMEADLRKEIIKVKEINFLGRQINFSPDIIKNLAFALVKEIPDLFLIIGSNHSNKASLTIMLSESLTHQHGLNAGNIIREIASEINGGGGGQPHFATAGGTNINGISNAIEKAKSLIA